MITYQDIPETIDGIHCPPGGHPVVQAQGEAYDDLEDSLRDTNPDPIPVHRGIVVHQGRAWGRTWAAAKQILSILLGFAWICWSTWQMIQSGWVAYDYHQVWASIFYLFAPWATCGFVWGFRVGKRGYP